MKSLKELEKDYKDLKKEIKLYNEKCDFNLVDKAWEFSKLAHGEIKRKSGDFFIAHPLATAIILADWKMDTASIVCGFLHDTVEWGGANEKDIKNEFGDEVAYLVAGVTQVSYAKLKETREEWFVENLRRMFLAMAKDLRVVVIKMAERLDNMRTLSYLSPSRQKRMARETLEVFAPLAERLAMGEVKSQLEDLAFEYTYPEEFERVKKELAEYYLRAEKDLKTIKQAILKKLAKEGVKAIVQSRKKHLYSLWAKLNRPEKQWDFEKINDIVALRILVHNTKQCYTALGVLHGLYKPAQGIGIRDYIARPKPNGYRSIHTNIVGPQGRIAEVQIRTHSMHEENEFGVAAHWHLSLLKAKGKLTSRQVDEGKFGIDTNKLKWVKELAKWQKEIVDSDEFLEAVKFDALSERIFVFSPKGDVYDLPLHASPIDFAYAVHTELGNYIKSAKVNGKQVALNKKLHNGDVVEIIKSKNVKKPSHSWVDFVVTTTAKRKIKSQLRLSS
jgi:GTP pyrophosphokinase